MNGLVEKVNGISTGQNLKIDRGNYNFSVKDTFKGEFYPSNNDGGIRNVVFYVHDKENIEIDGNGSNFIFDGNVSPFVIENCENITLKNLTIDFLKPLCVQAEVISSNEEYIDLKTDKKIFNYELQGENILWDLNGGKFDCESMYIFDYDNDCRSGRKNYIMSNFVVGSHTEKHADSCWVKTTCGTEFPQYLLVKAKEIKSGVVRFEFLPRSARMLYGKGKRLVFMFNKTPARSDDTIFIAGCKNVRLENVNIRRGIGMGIIAQLCENLEALNCSVAPNFERGDLVSTLADSMMFVDCRGELSVKNSFISSSIDDGLNVHGTYSPVDGVKDNVVFLHSGHTQQRGYLPYRVGDRMRIIERETLKAVFEGSVIEGSISDDKSNFVVTVDRNAPLEREKQYVAYNASAQPFVRIENCEYERSTCVLISSENEIDFKNNKVHTLCGAMRIKDDPTIWYESGKTNAVNIIGNDFINCGEWSYDYLIQFITRGGKGEEFSHRNAVIAGNKFIGGNTQYLKAENVSGITFKDNYFRLIDEIPSESESVILENCENADVKIN